MDIVKTGFLLFLCMFFVQVYGQAGGESGLPVVEEDSLFVAQFGELLLDHKPHFEISLTDTSQTQKLPPVRIWNVGKDTLFLEKLGSVRGGEIEFPEILLPNDTGLVQILLTGKEMSEAAKAYRPEIFGKLGLLARGGQESKVLFSLRMKVEHIPTTEELKNYAFLVLDTNRFDLGQVVEGENSRVDFKVRNDGNIPLVFYSVKCNSGCCTGTPVPRELEPGEEGVIRFSMSTTGRVGKSFRSIFVRCNAINLSNFRLDVISEIVKDPFRPGGGPGN